MADPISATISLLALAVSAATAWLTLCRKGKVRMTQPTVVFWGPDDAGHPKVFLRTLLFSTSRRGHVIENMHVAVSSAMQRQQFNIWVYGDEKLVRGSGMYVGETGVAANHHFLLPTNAHAFRFQATTYQIDVYARLLGKRDRLLFSQALEISETSAKALEAPDAGLYFDWAPDTSSYVSYVDRRPPKVRDGR
jgi:hypothetical protein